MRSDPSKDYIEMICRLYGDSYDDREEDSSPGGLDWHPGQKAKHKSLAVFKHELEEQGIELSTAKITKILITGGCWSTERTREIGALYEDLITPVEEGGPGLEKSEAIQRIVEELGLSKAMVCMSLPYERPVYDLDDKSSNAERCAKWRGKKDEKAVKKAEIDGIGLELAENLRKQRAKAGVSIEEAAEYIGVKGTKLQKWEENAAKMGVGMMTQLIHYYQERAGK